MRESSCPVQFQEGVDQWYIIWGKFPKINPQGLILGGAKYRGFWLALICFSGIFSRKGDIFGIVGALSVSFSDSRCYVLSSSKYFLKKNRLEMLLYKYNFNIAIMQHNLLATDRIKLTLSARSLASWLRDKSKRRRVTAYHLQKKNWSLMMLLYEVTNDIFKLRSQAL